MSASANQRRGAWILTNQRPGNCISYITRLSRVRQCTDVQTVRTGSPGLWGCYKLMLHVMRSPPDISPSLPPASSHDNTQLWPGGRDMCWCPHSINHCVVTDTMAHEETQILEYQLNTLEKSCEECMQCHQNYQSSSIFKKPVWSLAPLFWISV